MAVSQMSLEPMFINGEWTDGTSSKRIPVYDPSTEEVIAEIPDASGGGYRCGGSGGPACV